MSEIDRAVAVLAARGLSAERISDMLAETLGRLVMARCTTANAQISLARRSMEAMKREMERCPRR